MRESEGRNLHADLEERLGAMAGALEVVALLCKDEFGSSDCDSAFRKGVYDAATGTQLEGKFELKEDGARIDTETYELLEESR